MAYGSQLLKNNGKDMLKLALVVVIDVLLFTNVITDPKNGGKNRLNNICSLDYTGKERFWKCVKANNEESVIQPWEFCKEWLSFKNISDPDILKNICENTKQGLTMEWCLAINMVDVNFDTDKVIEKCTENTENQ
ncbi:uncharacterized protein LOC143239099 isoform X2 [Tachypleus tridentatus]|uniref:uncharacterized protein LOC143239099 isoform X2 n=1 Tax=Tachypleus tridentatus TaxID=6853 RepID=UPI003FD54146